MLADHGSAKRQAKKAARGNDAHAPLGAVPPPRPHAPVPPLTLLGCAACASREWPRRNGPSWPRVAAWRIGSAPPSSSGYRRLRRAELRVAPLPTQLAAPLVALGTAIQHPPDPPPPRQAWPRRALYPDPAAARGLCRPWTGRRRGDLGALVPVGRDRSLPLRESSAPWTSRRRE